MFSSSDEESPERSSLQYPSTPDSIPVYRRAELPSLVQHHVTHDHTSTPGTDQFFTDDTTEEHFPTAALDDDIWMEDQVPDRHLCIHDTSQLDQLCHYPCPYTNLKFEMDIPPAPTLEAADFGYDMMDLNDVSADLKDIMTTTSDEDIPVLEDICDCLESNQHVH